MLIPLIPNAEFDIYRVNEIRFRLDEKSYELDPRQIASKFLNLERILERHC